MRSVFALAVPASLLLLVGAFVGCSGAIAGTPSDSSSNDGSPTTDAGPTSNDAATTDATVDSGRDAGRPPVIEIWPPDAQEVVADSPGGGFTPPPPPGSTCKYGAEHFTLKLDSSMMTYERCASGGTPTAPLQLIKGTRKLTPAEVATIDAAMKQLVPAGPNTSCGADKGLYTVDVTTPRGTTTYHDSFYACQGGGKQYVNNIDGVFSAFRQLVPLK